MTAVPPIDVSPAEWAIIHDILARFARPYPVWAFGSRASGRAKPFSDLDIAVIADQPLDLGMIARLYEAFQESELPFKVDVVDWASTSPAFQDRIAAEKVALPI